MMPMLMLPHLGAHARAAESNSSSFNSRNLLNALLEHVKCARFFAVFRQVVKGSLAPDGQRDCSLLVLLLLVGRLTPVVAHALHSAITRGMQRV
jgi:hypothetical protein